MPVKFTISAVLVGKSLKVTIPRELCEHLKLEKGDAFPCGPITTM